MELCLREAPDLHRFIDFFKFWKINVFLKMKILVFFNFRERNQYKSVNRLISQDNHSIQTYHKGDTNNGNIPSKTAIKNLLLQSNSISK